MLPNGGSATISVCVASNARKGYFRALSAWREGALGAYPRYSDAPSPPAPSYRRPNTWRERAARPGPPPQNLLQETNT